MTVLVTGGAGFICLHAVDMLLEQNHSVRMLDNFSNRSKSNLLSDYQDLDIIKDAITNSSDVKTPWTGLDQCTHLAAQVSVVSSVEDASFSAQ